MRGRLPIRRAPIGALQPCYYVRGSLVGVLLEVGAFLLNVGYWGLT